MKKILAQKDLDYLASVNKVSTQSKKLKIYYRGDFIDEIITDNVRYLEDYISGVVKDAYKQPNNVDIVDESGDVEFTFKTLIDKPSEVYKRVFK